MSVGMYLEKRVISRGTRYSHDTYEAPVLVLTDTNTSVSRSGPIYEEWEIVEIDE
jgi:hypothetical protein